MSFTVLLVDDHPIVRNAYRHTIETAFEDALVLCCDSLASAFVLLDSHPAPDFALVDLNLPDACGIATLGAFRSRAPAVRVVALSGSVDPELIQACRNQGAAGFMPKTYLHEQFLSALRQLKSGASAFPDFSGRYPAPAPELPAPRLYRGTTDHPPGLPRSSPTLSLARAGQHGPSGGGDGRHLGLTDRQRGVLRLMLQGLPNKVICRELALAEGTVKVHVSAVLRALGVATRAQVVVAAMRSGIRVEDIR